MRLVRTLKLVLPLALLAAQPAVAAASGPPAAARIPAPQAQFRLHTADGYSVSVAGSGRKVTLTVGRGFASATYATRGRASRGAIRARFGHLGLVSVRFKPRGRSYRTGPPGNCKGSPSIGRDGVFVGAIRFRGEDGYVTVASHRARGSSASRPRWRCARRGAGRASASRGRPRLEAIQLLASTPGKQVFFAAVGLRERWGKTIPFALLAATRERRGSVRVSRVVLEFPEKDRAFAVAADGKTATLRPSRPFHGMASFDRHLPGPERWSGTLSVNMLGATVPLTGSRFRAHLKIKGGPDGKAAGDEQTATFGDFLLAGPVELLDQRRDALDDLLAGGAHRFERLALGIR